MKSLEKRFQKFTQKHPDWSTWTCFVLTVKEQNFAPKTIQRWFARLVDKSDFAQSEKRQLFDYLITITKPRRKT